MIASILDNDLYKFTMQQAVLDLHPEVRVTYELINRTPTDRFNRELFEAFHTAVAEMSRLELRPDERRFLEARCPFFTANYLKYLGAYRYDPGEVDADLDAQGGLSVRIRGPWHRAILWEVPVLALISELYGRHVKTDWSTARLTERTRMKGRTLAQAGCAFADFGTRRRASYAAQDTVVRVLCESPTFLGTSNLHLAHKYDVRPIGTMAHEWIMAYSVLADLRHANRFALQAWHHVYRGQLGIALTDTYGTEAFWADFDAQLARQYDGLRQDSGCPLRFTDRAIQHYRQLGIDPTTKIIVFSDGLTAESAVRIRQHCGQRTGSAFGIGTHLTHDVEGLRPLNIVIKLRDVDAVPVVKLTDDRGKATGDPEALRLARQTLHRTSDVP